MFKFEEVLELIRLVADKKISSVEIDHGGSRLRIDGIAESAPQQVLTMTTAEASGLSPMIAPQQIQAAPAVTGSNESGAAEEFAGLHAVTSPIVGTFYRKPNPEAENYVKVGDHVEAGQVLCIVEAMKLFNEIESDASGEIVKIVPADAQPVEFGETLFYIRKD